MFFFGLKHEKPLNANFREVEIITCWRKMLWAGLKILTLLPLRVNLQILIWLTIDDLTRPWGLLKGQFGDLLQFPQVRHLHDHSLRML